ncbi:hypothetical protein [Marinovum sp.]|uniref:hypothetical protein n=1 Tax=Marinovum sp. TaxID=2024839 RepID=UPI003A951F93
MKNVLALTALVLAGVATTASAATVNAVNAQAIHQYAPEADLSSLSDTEILLALNAINSGESRAEVTAQVRALTNTAG